MLNIIVIICTIFFGSEIYAGILFSPSLGYSVFSFEPKSDENTPNYQGMSPELQLGYSFFQRLDFSLAGQYNQANFDKFSLEKESARLYVYGVVLGARISNILYVGFRGGKVDYRLYEQTTYHEVAGKWQGASGGLKVGAIIPSKKKDHATQISLAINHHVLQEIDNPLATKEKRRMNEIQLSFAYVFNAESKEIGNKLLGSYLKSLVFWD